MPGLDTRALYQALVDSLSTHDVRSCDRVTRALYATDASVYHSFPSWSLCRRRLPMSLHLRFCRQFRVPITARGGGTSQAGQSIGPGVIIDCSRYFNQVLEINPEERWARVEPGFVLDELKAGRAEVCTTVISPDISTSNRATIGGMIANNSAASARSFTARRLITSSSLRPCFPMAA